MVASSAVITANWISFLAISASFIILLVISLRYKGPGGTESFYNGFKEQNMLTVFINLWCALAYFAKVLQSHSNDNGFAPLTVIPYVDYCTTCPLLTLDLLWCLDAPYKISSAVLVFTCLVIAVACSLAVAPFSYCWFAMGMVLFTFTYVFILSIVRQRLDFFTLCARDSNAKQSLKHLKTAVFIYFGIWLLFPLLWLLSYRAANVISNDINHIFHCILDVIAKSVYGFALLYFKMYFDKKLIESGIDEDDFAKFSKVVTTHRSEEKQKRKPAVSQSPKMYYDEAAYQDGEVESNLQSKIRKSLSRKDKTPGSPSRSPMTPRTAYSTRKSPGMHLNDHPAWGSLQASAHSWENEREGPVGDHDDEEFSEFCQSLPKKAIPPLNSQPHMYNSEDEDDGAYLERAKMAYQKAKERHDNANGQRERRDRSGSRESDF
ncbi:hypothetical protein GUITHDRAFT_99928 [Guillardia theta CCMP2712]|uniref:Uncharacterized protein n=2 Tax=Guillardia theta TaxID=55529 RepID=L1K1K8_GUITC|nr:hypothetical protein GUITHDRAFT_99928 [Guillardia theta CCMP2712]EKX54449.1 hypothetical protein GUITHDRAFT_99928 [Guillardia theta CCMP2712]|eukprot:XP_005841429.1 hypothetical protein GUITHDRAFT_99928 [Guillardia theta CCMP2712]